MGWNASIFTGQVLSSSNFQITLGFTSMHNANQWNLTTVYGPCQGQEKQNFIDWLYNLQIADDQDWMIVGDFNMYRSTENRNREGGNMTDVFTFNEIISSVGCRKFPSKEKITLGPICKKILSLNKSTGALLQLTGLVLSRTL